VSSTDADARAAVQWLASVAVKRIPRKIHGDKNWGRTKKVWAGVEVDWDGLKMETHRRFREVRDGRWIRYELALPESGDELRVAIDRVQYHVPSASHAESPSWWIDAKLIAPMEFSARIERWNFGMRWYSVKVEGKLTARLATTLTLAAVADYGEVPPALMIDPGFQTATLSLERFEVDRVSKIGGDAAEAWGEIMQEVIRELFLDKLNRRLAAKLNDAVDGHRDDLKISIEDWLSRWHSED
jgi:hypothetical protein